MTMRLFALCLAGVFLFYAQAQASINTKSPRYASLVMDADTQEVLYARNADAKRYPASLTKMMTLYLTFEALKKKKITLDTRLHVSPRAASQPQTNISLQRGQSIRVDDAIRALVVRSANDVAVVVAEALGKTESEFAVMMTQKARALGMKHTQFRNAHGLPDLNQFTTARDMARLAMALRRDYPQYYHYFNTRSFSWGRTTYTSHNRVLSRYRGADGLKTGFINMSGFNVATSVRRDGHRLVAVVMGGQNGQIRDNHMIALLDKSFTTLAERKREPRILASAAPVNAPLPVAKPVVETGLKSAPLPWQPVAVKTIETTKAATVAAAKTALKPAPAAPAKTIAQAKAIIAPTESSFSANRQRMVQEFNVSQQQAPATLNYQLAKLSLQQQVTPSLPQPVNATRAVTNDPWGIQVGAFTDEQAAFQAASQAVKMASDVLKYSTIKITDQGAAQQVVHRARLLNLRREQAQQACQKLSAANTPCFVFRQREQEQL